MRTDATTITTEAGQKATTCSVCGSDRVSRDAWADWDAERQRWVLGAVFDDGFYDQREAERKLIEVERTTGVT